MYEKAFGKFDMKKIDINALDAFFSYLNKPTTVFWLRDKTYKKQIYISPSFEQVWEIPCASLYEDAESSLIKSTLIEDDASQNWIKLDEIKEEIGASQTDKSVLPQQNAELLLKIKTPQGKQRFIQDTHFLLVDQNGNHLGFCGIAEELTHDEWHAKYYAQKSALITPGDNLFKKHLFDLLKKEAGISSKIDTALNNLIPLYAFKQRNREMVFTQRESECIHYLRQGKSAKQTAALLHISARTVEFHLNNARIKAQCRSKLELLTKVFIKHV